MTMLDVFMTQINFQKTVLNQNIPTEYRAFSQGGKQFSLTEMTERLIIVIVWIIVNNIINIIVKVVNNVTVNVVVVVVVVIMRSKDIEALGKGGLISVGRQ